MVVVLDSIPTCTHDLVLGLTNCKDKYNINKYAPSIQAKTGDKIITLAG